MAGLDIRIGHDKQPAPVIPTNAPLYNLLTGEILTDAGGTALVSEQDVALASFASASKSTSICFTEDGKSKVINDANIKGRNFEARNDAIYKLDLVNTGGGYAADQTNVGLPGGAIVSYTVDVVTGAVTQVVVDDPGDGYAEGAEFDLIAGGSDPANYASVRISQVSTLLTTAEPDSTDFRKDLAPGDRVVLPTGRNDQNVRVYEERTIFAVPNDYQAWMSTKVTEQLLKDSNDTGFGIVTRKGFILVDPVLPVAEEFPLFSEVSSTILGIPKAETQLGLFSNVSSYGLDEDAFLFYRDNSTTNDPTDWATRKNPLYGRHRDRSSYIEQKDESAIVLDAFRVPYGYPYGPNPNNIGYPFESHVIFCNFLKMGCLLYDYFKPGGPGHGPIAGPPYNDTGAFASKFVPYAKNHVTAPNFFLDPVIESTRPSPYYDGNGVLITPFLRDESIYRYSDWDTINNQPLGGAVPIGTVRAYTFLAGVLHFNEEVGFLREANGDQDLEIIGGTSKTRTTITSDMTFVTPENFFWAMTNPINSQYPNRQSFFDQLAIWTETWRDIRSGSFTLPNGAILDADEIDSNPYIQKYIVNALSLVGADRNIFNRSKPGYGSNRPVRSYLVSKKAFRYQPGRISGYTFGVRSAGDATTNEVNIEWGIGNETDQLLFRNRGGNISIVRRSVVPLPNNLLLKNGLRPQDQFVTQINTNPQNTTAFTGIPQRDLYEIEIPRDDWNGDPLNGNGPSGWNWRAEDVTMYKIEFGWYGAIGIQFYAYVPIENNEARWVKLHRIIIENYLGQPCMGDPYYKFQYTLEVNDHDQVRSPQFIYKYGTSCYIDGGDEGTVKVGAATSDFKTAPVELAGGVSQATTLIGLIPKTVIYNNAGEAVKNKQQIFPRELSTISNGLTEISLVKCRACPGFGHTYQTNINSFVSGDLRYIIHPQTGIVAGTPTYDRGTFELPVLLRLGTISSGSDTITLTAVDPNDPSQEASPSITQFLRVGDIVNPNESNDPLFGGGDPPYITEINGNDIRLNKVLTNDDFGNPYTLNNFTFEIQPLWIGRKDEYAKVIASRVWLTYIGSRLQFGGSIYNTVVDGVSVQGYTTTQLVTVGGQARFDDPLQAEAFRYFEPRTLQSFRRINPGTEAEEIIPTDTQFPCRLAQYDAVAGSALPVVGKKNQLLFMLPNYGNPDNGIYSDGQYSDWRIGITTLRPTQPGGPGNDLVWERPGGAGPVSEFTNDYKLYAERFNLSIFTDADGFETGEWNYGRIPPFTVDYRIPQPPGTNTGRCAYIEITVGDPIFATCDQVAGSSNALPDLTTAFQDAGYVFGNTSNDWYLRFPAAPPFTYDPSGAEIGFNQNDPNPLEPLSEESVPISGSGVRYASGFVTYEDNGTTYNIAKIDSKLYTLASVDPTPVTTYLIPVSLETYRKFATKSFDYNPFPLYFFIEMRDAGRINGAVIKESTQVDNVYNPRWLGSPSITLSNDNIEVGPIGNTAFTTGDQISTPPNFTSPNRLSSTFIDTQSDSQLRPYEVVDKFYVGAETKTIDLRSIFGPQRETITPDLLNTTAYFFIATSKEASATEIAGTLNYIEQQ